MGSKASSSTCYKLGKYSRPKPSQPSLFLLPIQQQCSTPLRPQDTKAPVCTATLELLISVLCVLRAVLCQRCRSRYRSWSILAMGPLAFRRVEHNPNVFPKSPYILPVWQRFSPFHLGCYSHTKQGRFLYFKILIGSEMSNRNRKQSRESDPPIVESSILPDHQAIHSSVQLMESVPCAFSNEKCDISTSSPPTLIEIRCVTRGCILL